MKRKLGQNFLIDRNIAEKEIKSADIKKNDIVLEIGPGKGILTEILSKRAKKVIAVEIDSKLADNLLEKKLKNVEIINDDILKIDMNSDIKFDKVVSNLPYQISSPFTFNLIKTNFDLAVIIYQKEFALRMVAYSNNKNYSRLSVAMSYYTNSEILDIVSKNCFNPKPRVDSCIVRIIPRKEKPFYLENEQFFFILTRELFNHRRKKIKTIISSKYKDIKLNSLPFLDDRVENLTPREIGILSNKIYKLIN